MSQEVEDIFREAGAVLEGHFELTSGLHSPVYWEKFRVLTSPPHAERLCTLIAARFRDAAVDVVAGPTLGGVVIAYEVARQLGVRSVYAERGGQGREFRRGASLAPGQRVLVVDDILTTGSSTSEVVRAVKELGAHVVGVAVLVDRSAQGITEMEGCPVFSCHQVSTVTYHPDTCPLCAQGVPLTRPGASPPSTPR